MAIYVTQIGKHRFICGLFWQSLSRPRELLREARELARKIDSDLLVLRTDQSTAQAGFAHSAEGARRGMYSLGAVVSKTLAIEGAYYDGEQQPVHNWLAAFKLPDGQWAYFAVRDANFLPNGDFAGSKEEVLERLHGDYGLGGWNVVLGDPELADYGFHNFDARGIESLIPRRKNGEIRVHRWWGLQQRQVRRPYRRLAIAAGLAALALGGGMLWQQRQRAIAERERDQALAAMREKMLHLAAPAAQPHPWGTQPAPLALARACVERLAYLTPGGWQLDDYVCTGAQVRYAWTRRDSTAALLRAEVPGATVELSGDRASYALPLQLARKPAEALLGRDEVLEPIISQLQLMGIAHQLASTPAPIQPAGAGAPPWLSYSFKVDGRGLAPTTLAAMLERPGVRIDKLVYRGGLWSIEGVIYAK
ncbi:type 4b pilus protein PilO2 [Duganella radicis]|uniref:Type 4b pilus protein PilO2 n=1 Tax=Duganella radicis TaxID=551988 RepID=A0A6L6PRK1_9BURK|nr:type 4b pilus protein PilO2 [Duganella radicis]MTV41723.1 type 4b pilus protein PilO2 [Duganella radicis]